MSLHCNFSGRLFVTASETIKRTTMKRTGIIILLTAFLLQGFSQGVASTGKESSQGKAVTDTNDMTRVIVGKDLIVVEDDEDATKIKVGNRGVTILESLEEGQSRINFDKFETPDREPVEESYGEFEYYRDQDDDKEYRQAHRRSQFKGHWSGFEIGLNNYMTSDNSFSLPDEIDYMTLHSSKSMNFNLNFSQMSIGFTRHFGLVTGLGIRWNNYRFDGNNNIQKGDGGVIEILDPGDVLKKSKLSTTYLSLPLMLEMQIPADYHRLNIAVGAIGAVKLCSESKMIYENGDKVTSDSDFSLNMLRYGATARIGFENFQIYGTYFMSPLFKEGKSPAGIDLHPFEVGIAFTVD
jgi:hypothetical protein